MNGKKYTKDGYLIVSEMDSYPLWEKDTIPCRCGCNNRCFFCRFANFRTEEFIRRTEEMPRGEPLYSVCRNEKNRIKESEKEIKSEN